MLKKLVIELLDSDFYYSQKYQIYVKGYILHNASFYEKKQMAELALEIIQQKNWQILNGQFIIIYKYENKIIVISDLIRSYPLFYRLWNNKLYFSQEASKLLNIDTEKKLNVKAAQIYYHTGYCIGNQSLIKDIWQTQAAEILTFRPDYSTNSFFYYNFITQKKLKTNFNQAKIELKKILFEIFNDYLPLFKSKQILIPLSGGLDSRLIAYMLHQFKIKNVLCFTYGKKNNAEVEISKQVADKLNFKWIFIDYEKFNFPPLEDANFLDYIQFMGNYASMPYLQEYIAISYLKNKNLISDDSIFIPGHSADFTAGSHLRPYINEQTKKNEIERFVQQNIFRLNGKFHYNSLKNKNFNFNEIENKDYQERQCKFIVNSARIFSYFGYDYILPFWDRRFQIFFTNLPYSFRLYKKLYNSTLEELFKTKKIDFKISEIRKNDFKFRKIKSLLKKFLPYFIKKHRLKRSDWMNYEAFTTEMLAELQKTGYKFYADEYNAIITAWYLKYCQEKIDFANH